MVLLVTHQLQYAKEADSICMINLGEVKAMGTLNEIRGVLDQDFSDFLKEDVEEEEGSGGADDAAVEPELAKSANGPEAKGKSFTLRNS